MDDRVLHCPFCGNKAEVYRERVRCDGCALPWMDRAAWNLRAVPPEWKALAQAARAVCPPPDRHGEHYQIGETLRNLREALIKVEGMIHG